MLIAYGSSHALAHNRDGRGGAVARLDGEAGGGIGVQQASLDQGREGLAFLEAAAELDVRVAPQKGALLHPLCHPVAG